jgi:hypothetical protein
MVASSTADFRLVTVALAAARFYSGYRHGG